MGAREDWIKRLSRREREVEAYDASLLDPPELRGSAEDYRRRFLVDEEEDLSGDPDPLLPSLPYGEGVRRGD